MPNFKDITGQKFGRLLTISPAYSKNDRWYWNFLCDCGNKTTKNGKDVRAGHTKSCGCQRLNPDIKTHGMTKSPTYKSWCKIKERCNNPKVINYPRYGGRGITVCDRWVNSFENFYADMGERPANTSIDRIDNSGNYEPFNCRWASLKTQANNARSNRIIEYHGESHTLSEWCDIKGINYNTFCGRFFRGWSIERAFTQPVRKSPTKLHSN